MPTVGSTTGESRWLTASTVDGEDC